MPRPKQQQLKQRPDGRYRCKYQDQYFYGTTAKEALDAREEYKRQLALGRAFRKQKTVRDYSFSWLPVHKAHVSEKCYNDYASLLDALFPFIGHKLLSEVTVDDAAAVWQHFSGYSASTIKRARMIYVALFDTAIENELCSKNPFKSKFSQPPKGSVGSHRALEDWEVELVRTVPHRMQLPALIMLYAGLRRGEALALSAADIDLRLNQIAV